jgi:dihydrodipicolinate synthase/N-acetylneuraminate lyase
MNLQPVSPELLTHSVVALPPLARDENLGLSLKENQKLVRSIEAGGIRVLLYGANALLQHLSPREYAPLLAMLEQIAGPNTTVIPSIDPAHGPMTELVEILRSSAFPSVHILPPASNVSGAEFERIVGDLTDRLGKPTVLAITGPNGIAPEGIRRRIEAGQVSLILYQAVADDPAEDPLLRELVDTIDPKFIVSGLGEPFAIVHLREYGVGGFASSCACVASRLSQCLLEAIRQHEWGEAEEIRGTFRPLEELRRKLEPVSVLHEALGFAGIASMGPLPPMLRPVNERYLSRIREAAQSLRTAEL